MSGGQQQRVMWARMLFALERVPAPRFALLDEATAAISSDWVGRLYAAAKARGVTLVSIAHNRELAAAHHARTLALGAGGTWEVC